MKPILLLFLVFSLTAAAQHGTFGNEYPPETSDDASFSSDPKAQYLGLRFGFTLSQLRATGLKSDKGSKAGLTAGLVVGWRLFHCPYLYLESGLLYAAKGANVLAGDASGAEKEHIRMHVLEWPLVVKGRIGARSVQLCPFGGVYASLGFKGRTRSEFAATRVNTYRTDGFKKIDAGLRFGLGIYLKRLYIDAAYDIGLVDVTRRHIEDFRLGDTGGHLHTGALAITCGVDF